MTTTNDLAARWCRMWNADPDLAYDLVTDDLRQWSGLTPGLDDVVGPGPTAEFVARWAIDPGPRFTPRLVVADGDDRLAYTWDAALPDGRVKTGMDVNVLRAGRVAENWTVAGDRRVPAPDPAPCPASREVLTDLVHRWVRPDGGPELADDVVLRSARADTGDVEGAAAVEAYLRARGPAAVHRDPVIDADRGRAALTWTAGAATGLEVLVARDGRLVEVWSVPAARPFRF